MDQDDAYDCCVPMCESLKMASIQFYHLPIYNDKLLKIWKRRINNSKLNNIADKNWIRMNYQICERHFDPMCKIGADAALHVDSCPTIGLPHYKGDSAIVNCFYPVRYTAPQITESVKTTADVDFANICRVCCNVNSNLYDVEESTYQGIALTSMLASIAAPLPAAPLTKDVPFPKSMCNECVDTLLYTFDFRRQIIDSTKYFNAILSGNVIEKPVFMREKPTPPPAPSQSVKTNDNLLPVSVPVDVVTVDSETLEVELGECLPGKTRKHFLLDDAAKDALAEQLKELIGDDLLESVGVVFDEPNEEEETEQQQQEQQLEEGRENVEYYVAETVQNEADPDPVEESNNNANGDDLETNDITRSSIVVEKVNENSLQIVLPYVSDVEVDLDSDIEQLQGFSLRQEKTQYKTTKLPRFSCPYCMEKYYQERLRDLHVYRKHELITCEICFQQMSRSEYSKVHRATHQDVLKGDQDSHAMKQSCPKCERMFTPSLLNSHRPCYDVRKIYQCDDCTFVTSFEPNLTRHARAHRMVDSYKCYRCGFACIQKTAMRNHMRQHMNLERRTACRLCPMTFLTMFDRQLHLRQVHNFFGKKGKCMAPVKTYKVAGDKRNKYFDVIDPITHKFITRASQRATVASKPSRSRNVAASNKETSHGAMSSNMMSTTEQHGHVVANEVVVEDQTDATLAVQEHNNYSDDDEELSEEDMENEIRRKPIFRCRLCQREYLSKQSITKHLTTAHDVGDYQCPQCDRSFFKTDSLSAHIKVTHEVNPTLDDLVNRLNPFTCEHCTRTFPTDASLQDHQRFHAPDRRYVCDICNMRYRQRNQLFAHHRQVHSNNQLYGCAHCPRSFKYKQSLEDHRRVHTGERLHCLQCERKFLSSAQLTKHMRNEHRMPNHRRKLRTMQVEQSDTLG